MDLARGRLLRSRRAPRIQRPASTDASKKLTDPDQDEQVLRHGGKPRHFLERLVPQGRLVTQDFAQTGDAEEYAPQHSHGPKCGIHGRLRSWLVHCFAIHCDSRLLSRLRRPVGRFNTELLGVLRVEPRPTELHRLASDDAADGSSAEKATQNIETNVPPCSTH